MEIGIPYVLTGPDGTRAVFNDPTDADFVGYLDSENGITGLLDTAEVKESFDNRVEGDGTVQGNNFHGRRVGTMQGIIWPWPQMSQVNDSIRKVKVASRGMKALFPSALTWTPSGGVQRLMYVWRQATPKFSARRPKQFTLALATQDPHVYAASISSVVLIPSGGASGDQGISSPLTNPLQTVYQQTAQIFCVNQGDVETWPAFIIQGPITNPVIVNNSTGLSFTLTYSLNAGETLVVNSRYRTVLFNGAVNRYSAYSANFPLNTWWPLVPGSNDVRLQSNSYATGAQLTVSWRSAWEE